MKIPDKVHIIDCEAIQFDRDLIYIKDFKDFLSLKKEHPIFRLGREAEKLGYSYYIITPEVTYVYTETGKPKA